MNDFILKAFGIAARSQHIAITITRLGLILVLVWIGGLKIYKYEADGIVPFVANSPFMKFFLHFSAPEYKKHVNPEGAVVPANQAWHEENHTYTFSYGLGAVIVFYGMLLCLHPWKPELAALGSFLVIIMSFVTLSFLITTPECWVPDLGGPEHGFPLLSGRGRLVVKDAIMLGAAMVTMADSASAYLRKRSSSTSKATAQSHLPSNRHSVDVV
jgi:reactive chlorine resistance protein C